MSDKGESSLESQINFTHMYLLCSYLVQFWGYTANILRRFSECL